jgi:Tol biopolymer transport system component
VQGAAPYPVKPRRSIVPWLIGFIGVAALIVTALILLNIIDLSALSGSGAEPGPIAAIGDTQIAAGVIAPTDTATPPPTDTVPPVITTEEVVLIPKTGPSVTPTEPPTIEPSPTEEPTATAGPTPIGGGPGTIAFASDRSGNFQIWTIDVDGNNATRITDRQDGACQPTWSPDGIQLVFISPCTKNQDRYENTALYVINVDGSGERRLTDGIGGDYAPSWAPNDRIVFTSDRTNQTSIYTIDPEVGGEPAQLTRNSNNFRPDWSPDGKQIAFVSTRLSVIPKVFTMSHLGEIVEEGERAKEFSRGSEFAYDQPRYSPDGDFLMYKKLIYPPDSSSRPDLVGSNLVDIGLKEATIATSQSIGTMNEADYSPDGKWIVFESWPFSTHHIFIMSANGSNKTQVTEGGSYNFDAAWRPYLEP